MCPSLYATEFRCIFRKPHHITTDRKCQEWSRQQDIKKVIATENILFKEAQVFIKNKIYTSTFSYASVVNERPLLAPIDIFPSISENDIQQTP